MDKLKMQTTNKANENFKKLAAMFPNAITETMYLMIMLHCSTRHIKNI